MDNKKLINVRSIYGMQTKQALVEITIPEGTGKIEDKNNIIVIPQADARALALNILQACEASIVDAFLIEFMTSQKIIEDQNVMRGLVVEFRRYRQANYPDST